MENEQEMEEQGTPVNTLESDAVQAPVKERVKLTCPGCQSHLDVTDLAPFSVFACPRCGATVKVPQLWLNFALEDILSSAHGINEYRALDTTLDREVIIELITADGGYAEESQEAYLGVIRRMAGLVDTALGVIYSCGKSADGVYAVEQYLPESMKMSGEPSTWNAVKPWLTSILRAMQRASELSIVHGRLSPRYLRLTESGNLRVVGFGAGMALDIPATFDGYTCPERVNGNEASLAGDIYSLARIAWQSLAGRFPEEGGRLPNDVPKAVEEVLSRMMSLAPEQRPQSYAEVLEIVEKATVETGNGGHGAAKTGKKQKPLAKGGQSRVVFQPVRKSGGHGVAVVFLILLFAALAGVGIFALKSQDSKKRKAEVAQQAAEAARMEAEIAAETAEEDDDVAVEAPANHIETSQEAMNKGSWRPLPDELREMRPLPKNPLVMKSKKVQNYIKALPDDYRHGIEIQATILNTLPDVMKFYVLKNKYDRGADTILQLRKPSRKINACITMANDKGMRVKNLNERQKDVPERVTFDDLSRRTIMDMLDYYCDFSRQRLDSKDREYPTQVKSLIKHYFALIMLADWYNEREAAQKYVGICRELQPGNTKLFNVLEKFGYGNGAATAVPQAAPAPAKKP